MSNNTATLNTVGIDGLALQAAIAQATRLCLMISGDPGTGKTTIDRQIAVARLRKHGAEKNYIYVNASTKTAEYWGMSVPIVKNGSCDFFVADWFKDAAKLDYCHIFIDEIDKLSFRDQSPFLQFLTEGAVEGVHLKPGATWSCAGNFRNNGNGSFGVSNILTNRCSVVHFSPEPERVWQFLVASGAHPWVCSFIRDNPHLINNFIPSRERNETSRQWERVSQSLYALQEIMPNPSAKVVAQTVATRVPDETAQSFALQVELNHLIVPFDEVMKDPKGCAMPKSTDRGVHWLQVNTIASRAAAMKMAEKYNGMSRSKCKEQAFIYAERFAPEFLNAILPLIQLVASDDPNNVPGGNATSVPSGLWNNKALTEKIAENSRILKEG